MPICNLINVPRTTKWVMHDIPHIFTEKWHAKFPSHHLKKGMAAVAINCIRLESALIYQQIDRKNSVDF